MNETKPVESIEWTVSTDDESQWIIELEKFWVIHKQMGWDFACRLREGIDLFGRKREKSELYELISNQCEVSVKRLQNLVSMARKESSDTARSLGLEIAHAEAVCGLEHDNAVSLLTKAAEQSLTATALSAIIREQRQHNTASPDVPATGNQTDDELSDNNIHDVPFDTSKSNILYEDADYSAEADAYAGNVAGYDWADDDLELHPSEFADLLERAAGNLRQHIELGNSWCTTRSQRDWLKALEGLMY